MLIFPLPDMKYFTTVQCLKKWSNLGNEKKKKRTEKTERTFVLHFELRKVYYFQRAPTGSAYEMSLKRKKKYY